MPANDRWELIRRLKVKESWKGIRKYLRKGNHSVSLGTVKILRFYESLNRCNWKNFSLMMSYLVT